MTLYTPARRKADKKRSKVFSYFKRLLMVMGFFSITSILFSFCALQSLLTPDASITGPTILTYAFEKPIRETQGKPSLTSPLAFSQTRLHDIIQTLDSARTDDNIKGFIARLDRLQLSIAQVQELRSAIKRFKDSGKFTAIFAPSYGDFSNGMLPYYLASSFENVWLQPVGTVAITGVSGTLEFYKGTLDKIGLKADLTAREDYKTAIEPMTRTSPSAQSAEMTKRLISGFYNQMIAEIATDRNLPLAKVNVLVNQAPFIDEDAKAENLVDHLGYIDELLDGVEERFPDITYMGLEGYIPNITPKEKPKAFDAIMEKDKSVEDIVPSAIALIYAEGAILSDDASPAQINVSIGGDIISAKDISRAIHTARKNPNIGAIVLRLNSPGGSPTASETIASALARAQKDGIKVIVSMSTAAASGGYWIATHADQIIANPATLTGSIGVFSGKIVDAGLLDTLGIHLESYTFGAQANLFSPLKPFTSNERASLNRLVDNIYDRFLTRVSEGRNIPIETLRSTLAGGRVWTGKEALENGLVDRLGDLDHALNFAKSTIDPNAPDDVSIHIYPKNKTASEQIIELLTTGVSLNSVFSHMWQDLKTQMQRTQIRAYAILPNFE